MSLSETLIIVMVALLVFGPKQLPMLARHLGLVVKKFNALKRRYHEFLDDQVKEHQLNENIQKALEAENTTQETLSPKEPKSTSPH